MDGDSNKGQQRLAADAARTQQLVQEAVARLDTRPTPPVSPAAWFLGPNGENLDTLQKLTDHAMSAHAQARRDYAPKDPDFIDPKARSEKIYQDTTDALIGHMDQMLDALRGSIPLSSYRNQSHMYWDLTLPGAAGYFAAMLYNQNNVAAEASPVTTALEIIVAAELCRMLGYDPDAGGPKPWGHITCDGSIANGEALWAARNLRFMGLTLANAIREGGALKPARGVTVKKGDGRRARLIDLSEWELVNLPVPTLLGLPERIVQVSGVDMADLKTAIDRLSVQAMGLLGFYRHHFSDPKAPDPVVFVPATAHYSWDKAAAFLGLGLQALRPIPVDLDGRMKLPVLRAELDKCLAEHRPVLQVVAVMGSTAESAVDPIADIVTLRKEYREMGLDFAIHADGAWGGYFAAMLRDPRPGGPLRGPAPGDIFADAPDQQLSDYVRHHLAHMGQADSITVDPHKGGFIPYPAGALCYRDAAMPRLIERTSPVVYHGGAAPTVGVYGLEGSKPGAAPAAVYLSHRAIPPDRTGYGQLLGRCVFNSKRFYAALVSMPQPDDPFEVTPFKRLPAERVGATPSEIAEQRQHIADKIVGFDNDQLLTAMDQDPDLMDLFQALGADLTVTAYAFNFKTAPGLNTDLVLMNELNDAIFEACSIQVKTPDLPKQSLFLTAAAYDPAIHDADFIRTFAQRAGVTPQPGLPIAHLISTMQNPWVTESAKGNLLPMLMSELRQVVTEATAKVVARHGLTPFSPN